MPDYSEFPTTPTAWQEKAWQEVAPLAIEDPPPPPRRKPDKVSIVPGILFVVLAITLMTGLELPVVLFADGGILWLVLIGAGLALLISELRKARRRR